MIGGDSGDHRWSYPTTRSHSLKPTPLATRETLHISTSCLQQNLANVSSKTWCFTIQPKTWQLKTLHLTHDFSECNSFTLWRLAVLESGFVSESEHISSWIRSHYRFRIQPHSFLKTSSSIPISFWVWIYCPRNAQIDIDVCLHIFTHIISHIYICAIVCISFSWILRVWPSLVS